MGRRVTNPSLKAIITHESAAYGIAQQNKKGNQSKMALWTNQGLYGTVPREIDETVITDIYETIKTPPKKE